MSTTTLTVAAEILHQLGGNKFVVMTGAKHLLALDNGIRFTIGRNASKANRVEITLNGLDLYDVKFIKHTPYKIKVDYNKGTIKETEEKTVVLKEYNDVYFDMLQDIFTSFTGLYTHL